MLILDIHLTAHTLSKMVETLRCTVEHIKILINFVLHGFILGVLE
jgi:hypothetical protein